MAKGKSAGQTVNHPWPLLIKEGNVGVFSLVTCHSSLVTSDQPPLAPTVASKPGSLGDVT